MLVKETVSGAEGRRFEASIAARVAGLGATLTGIVHVTGHHQALLRVLCNMLRDIDQQWAADKINQPCM